MEKLKCKIGGQIIEVMGVKANTIVDLEFIRATDHKVAFMSKKGDLTITSMQLFKRWTNNHDVAQQFLDRGVWDIVPNDDITFENESNIYEAPELSQITVNENGDVSESIQSYPDSEYDEKIGKLSNLDLRHALMNILFFVLLLSLYLYQINNYEDIEYWQFISVFVALVLGNIYFIKQKRKLR